MNKSANEILLANISAKCAIPNYSNSQNIQASLYLGFYVLGLIPNLVVLPATAKLGKKLTGFFILFHINIMHIVSIVWFIELFAGHFLGHPIAAPFNLDVYLYQICSMAIALAYILLALNRIVAIMAPFFYCHFFTIRLMRIYTIICWAGGIAFSLFINFKPYLRLFLCISSLTAMYPPSMIQEDGLYFALIGPVTKIYTYSISYVPTALYVICLIWIVSKRVGQVIYHVTCKIYRNQHGAQNDQQQSQETPADLTLAPTLDNYSRERMRLYAICVFCTMPIFLLDMYFRLYFYFDETASFYDLAFITGYNVLYGLYNVQQPIVMMLLSKELRTEMGFDKLWKKIRTTKNSTTVTVQTIATKNAWAPQSI